MTERDEGTDLPPEAVAVIGMAGRFPGAESVEDLWQLLLAGREGITRFEPRELLDSGWSREQVSNPRMVPAGSVLADVDSFDAGFFEYSPREAVLMDPQHRLALEVAWHALEDAGHHGQDPSELVGVYAGCGPNTYLMHLLDQLEGSDLDGLQLTLGNEKDYLATRIAYRLNLSGPALSVQTACSTSLVAVHLACQGLLGYECDLALAGGVSVRAPQPKGYMYQAGSILSSDGHCRPFDAAASGTVYGNGVGFVALRRLEDAVAAGDRIVAVIRGTAINNDGAAKVGYTAPSIDGQAAVVRRALAVADLEASDIGYVESHGTATPLGDPIEIAALTQVFGDRKNGDRCRLGAIKSNLGHLDTAAGVVGLIKAALVVERGELPPTLHFQTPNPEIALEISPFQVVAERATWSPDGKRRAGVSSFGIGGTNAHVVLEQAPARETVASRRPAQVMVFSAATAAALGESISRLEAHLDHPRTPDLADVAYTLQVGRKPLAWRASVAATAPYELMSRLQELASHPEAFTETPDQPPRLVFLLPGQGSQYPGMGWDLWNSEPVFRQALEECAEIHGDLFGWDLLQAIRSPGGGAGHSLATSATEVVQPALFAVEHALARLWMAWGLRPDALLGHSVGEIVAARLAGVLSLEDAVRMVGHRGAVMQARPGGAMAAVHTSRETLRELLPASLGIAASNGPSLVTVSGSVSELENFLEVLKAKKIPARRLRVSHAFHSPMMDDAMPLFRDHLRGIVLSPPKIPWVSNVTGRWIEKDRATDLEYWVEHLRRPVLFYEGLECLGELGSVVALEVGPGQSLAKLARAKDLQAFPSLPEPKEPTTSSEVLRSSLGKVWERGLEPDWQEVHSGEQRLRVALPGYPFARQAHRLGTAGHTATHRFAAGKRLAMERWGYIPVWRQTPPARLLGAGGEAIRASVVVAGEPWLDQLVAVLEVAGQRVIPGPVEPGDGEGLMRLLQQLEEVGEPFRVICGWELESEEKGQGGQAIDPWPGLSSLFGLCRGLAELRCRQAHDLVVLTRGAALLDVEQRPDPSRGGLEGFCRVVGQEIPGMSCRMIDLGPVGEEPSAGLEELAAELRVEEKALVAYRGGLRFRRALEPVPLPEVVAPRSPWVQEGVYLITGGLGGLGLELAKFLAATCKARLALVVRTDLPPEAEWETLLESTETDQDLRRRIEGVRGLRSAGNTVDVLVADVTSRETMAEVLESTRRRLGPITGVFHLAAVPGGGLLQIRQQEDVARVLAPKVAGARVLLDLLGEESPPFLVLFSSITAVTGGIGQADYAAACSYLGSFAESRGPGVVTIDWDAWELDRWQQQSAHLAPAAFSRLREIREQFGVRLEEGFDVLGRVLMLGLPRVVISTRDPEAAVASHEQLAADFLGSASANGQSLETPALPQGEMEALVARIWQEVLGLEEVDPHANFVDLGGHSLMAIQLISRLGDALGTAVPLRVVFENPTVHRLAAFLSARDEAGPELDSDELERALDEVEGLSEEAARARLEQLLAVSGNHLEPSGDSSK